MNVFEPADEFEVVAELWFESLGTVTYHWKSAALRRSAWRERRDDERSAGTKRLSCRENVASSIGGIDKEVEDRSVVPQS